ncbi:MAG: ABC transporter permease [Pseudomonadota bacterium]
MNGLIRFWVVWKARNREFLRDRASMAWNILLPLLIVFGFSMAYTGDGPAQYRVGLYGSMAEGSDPLGDLPHIRRVPVTDLEAAIVKVERHQLDLLLDVPGGRYWVNRDSPHGEMLARALEAVRQPPPVRQQVSGAAVRYAHWLLPGILAMNMMFSCLFGVGYVVVRYRKNGVLKRFKATPLTAFEFLTAQLLSRLWLTLSITTGVFTLAWFLLGVPLRGNPLALFAVYACGAIALICLGLIVAARLSSQELADGLLNLITWPMMFLSGVWFSNEGLHPWLQRLAELLPLTHVTEAARAIMFDGAGFRAVAPHLAALLAMAAVFLLVGARSFRWE